MDRQRDNTEHLRHLLMLIQRLPNAPPPKPAMDWSRLAPIIVWALTLLGLLVVQVPLPTAVETITKLSSRR